MRLRGSSHTRTASFPGPTWVRGATVAASLIATILAGCETSSTSTLSTQRPLAPSVYRTALTGPKFDSTAFVRVLVSTAGGTPLCQLSAPFLQGRIRSGCPVPVPSDIAIQISGYLADSTISWTGTTVQRVLEGEGAFPVVIFAEYVAPQSPTTLLGRTESPVPLFPYDPISGILRDTNVSILAPSRYLKCPTPDAVIHYTTDGSMPSESSRILDEDLYLYPGTRLIAFAKAPLMAPSPMFSVWIGTDPRTVAKCTLSVARNLGETGFVVDATLKGDCPAGTIRYTTNSTRPTTRSPSTLGRISLSAAARIRAILFVEEQEASLEADVNFLLAGTPRLVLWKLEEGPYVVPSDLSELRIHFTRDGRNPTPSDSILPTQASFESRPGSLRAFVAPGMKFRGFSPLFGWTETLTLDSTDLAL